MCNLLAAIVILIPGLVFAMPPREGIVFPEKLIERMRELKVDIARRPVRNPQKSGQFNTLATCQLLVSGTKNFPVVLMRYNDVTQQYTVNEFQIMLFDAGGGWPSGSAHAWYSEVSYDLLDLTGTVSSWFMGDSSRVYYSGGAYGFGPWPRCAGRLVQEAVQKSDPTINFADFDNDGDGYVDCFTVVHCGRGAEETGNRFDIWSHMDYISSWTGAAYVTNDPDPSHPGQFIKVDLYTIDPERSSITNYGTMVCIGVFVHEWGHALGVPDLYDTDGGGQGLGNWCCMAGGSWGGNGRSPWSPVHFCSWAKADLGWIVPTVVAPNSFYQLDQVETNSQTYKLWTWGEPAQEYFLIENRQKTLFDAYLYNAGLFIYHIDENVIGARRPQNLVNGGGSYPYGVALEQADGQNHLWLGSNRGDANDPYPGGLNMFGFDSTGTNPDSRSNAGANTQCGVNQIPVASPSVNCWMYVGPLPVTPANLLATAVADQEIELTWQDNSDNEVAFSLERKEWDWGLYQEIATPPAGATYYLDRENIFAKTTYWYRLRTRNPAGFSGYSNEDSATTYGPPDAPSNLQAVVVSEQEIKISWQDNADDDEYFQLERSRAHDTWTEIAELIKDVTSYSDPNVVPGPVYYYRCRALNPWGFSDYSNVDSASIPVALAELKPSVPRTFLLTVPTFFGGEITYGLPRGGCTEIAIYNLDGEKVRTLVNEESRAGYYTVCWDGRDDKLRIVPAGLYFCRMHVGAFEEIRKIIKLK